MAKTIYEKIAEGEEVVPGEEYIEAAEAAEPTPTARAPTTIYEQIAAGKEIVPGEEYIKAAEKPRPARAPIPTKVTPPARAPPPPPPPSEIKPTKITLVQKVRAKVYRRYPRLARAAKRKQEYAERKVLGLVPRKEQLRYAAGEMFKGIVITAPIGAAVGVARAAFPAVKYVGVGLVAISAPSILRGLRAEPIETGARLVGYGIGGLAGARLVKVVGIKPKPPKIVEVKTRAIAVEETKLGRAIQYKVAAKPKVFVKRFLRKPKPVKVEVVGRVVARPTIKPKIYEARAVYAGRLPKKPVTIAARARALIKRKTPRITKQITAAEVYVKAKPKVPKKFVSVAYGFKAIEVPKGEVILTKGMAVQLLKKGRITKPFIEKGITIVKKMPEQPRPMEFGYRVIKPRPVPKPLTPIFAPTIAKVAKEVVMKAPRPRVKPFPVILPKKRVVKPSIYEGLGLYERTEEYAAVVPRGLQLERITIKEKLLIKAEPIIKVKERVRAEVRPKIAQQILPREMVKEKVELVSRVEARQLQKVAMEKAIPSTLVTPQIGVFPIKPMPIIPPYMKPLRRPKKIPTFRFPTFYRKELYIPSLVAIEMGMFAPKRQIKKFYKEVGALGFRPIPIKSKKYQIKQPMPLGFIGGFPL